MQPRPGDPVSQRAAEGRTVVKKTVDRLGDEPPRDRVTGTERVQPVTRPAWSSPACAAPHPPGKEIIQQYCCHIYHGDTMDSQPVKFRCWSVLADVYLRCCAEQFERCLDGLQDLRDHQQT